MTAHIEAKKEEIAKTVIMPGDPKRAKFIAENYLEDAKLVTSVRNILGFTGYYKNKKVTIMASGMGMPSIGIYASELYNFYDVDNIIRIGTCGALLDNVKVRDVIIVDEAYTLSNFSFAHSGKQINKISSTKYLKDLLENSAKKLNINTLSGIVNTSDLFYNEYEDDKVKENNCLASEMETFALFYLANYYNKSAASVLTVSNHLLTNEEISSKEREETLDQAIKIVLESL